ncbi:hypothetical protein G6F60_008819 [Rhizopus arrhizus]|nr:hypothetical protein G6F60_008819 [Rhizopus arrhizus]
MQHVVCVPRAKVPIVRLFDSELQLSCDINVNNTLALHNTKMIKIYVALDPRVRPLIMTIKHWTKQRLLNDAANGGTLSSYTWTCMIINFLQQREPPILPILHEKADEYYFCDNIKKWQGFGLKNKESLGGLLYAFFRRFSIEFDYENQVVSVRQGRYLTKKEKGWDTGRNKMSLCVEEPFDTSRNLGNSADISSVLGLRCEFQRCLDLLLDHSDLETLLSAYKPTLYIDQSIEIPTNNSFSVPLPTLVDANKTIAHPYGHQNSMADGIHHRQHCHHYYYPQEYSYSYRQPITHPLPTFYPHFNSTQVLDTVITDRNIRYGSQSLSHVSPTFISMLNTSTGQRRSVDSLYTRYHQSPTQYEEEDSSNSSNNYSIPGRNDDYFRRNVFDQQLERKQHRRSGGVEWPSISNHTQNMTQQPSEITMTPFNLRKWSIANGQSDLYVEKRKTLAEIIKIPHPCSSLFDFKSQDAIEQPASIKNTDSDHGHKIKYKKSSKSNSNANHNGYKQQKNKSNHRPHT